MSGIVIIAPFELVEISEEQRNRADTLLSQYGLRKAIFGPVLDDILDMIEEYGGIVIGVINVLMESLCHVNIVVRKGLIKALVISWTVKSSL